MSTVLEKYQYARIEDEPGYWGVKVETMKSCPVCESPMSTLFAMPKMPVCGVYEDFKTRFNDRGYIDQSFMFCASCSHGTLGTVVSTVSLYSHGYSPTSASIGSMTGVRNFASFVKEKTKGTLFDVVVDIGGNDGTLLSCFPESARVSVDPNASGDGKLVKQYVEDADLGFLKDSYKLVLSSHTLEHIKNPHRLLEKLGGIVNMADVCAFQFPSLDMLVSDCRIDQIYHEHIHYYSLRSISTLLAKHGFEILAHRFDASHYGALMVVFRKGPATVQGNQIKSFTIEHANVVFRHQARALDNRLAAGGKVIGYGGSIMLPLLAYYVPAVASLEYIVDENEAKLGQRYINLDLEIRPFHNMTGRDVMVTAYSTKMAVRRIVEKLFHMNAASVIVPFNYL